MTKLLKQFLIYTAALCLLASCASSNQEVYLFTSFHEPSIDGLRYLYSDDGLKWDSVPGVWLHPEVDNKDTTFIDAFTGETSKATFAPLGVMRDPSIVQGPDGIFHLVWTTAWGGSRGFGYAHSKDLIHWSKQRSIPVMANIPTNNVWAPEITYDPDSACYYIIWSSQIPLTEYTDADKLGTNRANRLYFTKTKDFNTFTPARRYYDPGFNSIDAFLVRRAAKDYVLVVKDNRKPGFSNLFCVFGNSPEGPFSQRTESWGRTFTEGPCVTRLPDGQWVVYYDQYHPQEYGASVTTDFRTFTPIFDRISVPSEHKHGTIIKVKKRVVKKILKAAK